MMKLIPKGKSQVCIHVVDESFLIKLIHFSYVLEAGAALLIEVDTDDAEPAPWPSKKPREPIKKKAKDLVKEASDEDEKKVRAPNYKEDKDVQICCSWLEISKDPLNSTNQTATTFWARVCEHYMTQIREHNHPIDSIKYGGNQSREPQTSSTAASNRSLTQIKAEQTTPIDWPQL